MSEDSEKLQFSRAQGDLFQLPVEFDQHPQTHTYSISTYIKTPKKVKGANLSLAPFYIDKSFFTMFYVDLSTGQMTLSIPS